MLPSEMMKTNLLLKGKDAGCSARSLHSLFPVWSRLSPWEPCCKILSCHVLPGFRAAWVCLMPDKSVEALQDFLTCNFYMLSYFSQFPSLLLFFLSHFFISITASAIEFPKARSDSKE